MEIETDQVTSCSSAISTLEGIENKQRLQTLSIDKTWSNNFLYYCQTDTTREWLATTRTTPTRTGRETMVYCSYRSWNTGDLHIISKTVV